MDEDNDVAINAVNSALKYLEGKKINKASVHLKEEEKHLTTDRGVQC